MNASVQFSALQLEGYYVVALSFNARPASLEPNFIMQGGIGVQHDGVYKADPLTINVNGAANPHPEDPHRWQHVLTVSSRTPAEREYPYDFVVTLVGYFIIGDIVPVDQREAFVRINGASILYSAARDLLATVTGRGPLPSVVLPVVSFAINAEPEQEQNPSTTGASGSARPPKIAKKASKKRATKKAGGKKQQR
jgi:preprotein translocase subunit SecB